MPKHKSRRRDEMVERHGVLGQRSFEDDAEEKMAFGKVKAVSTTFRALSGISRFLMILSLFIVFSAGLSYVFNFEFSELASSVLSGILTFTLLIQTLLLVRALWWSSDAPLDFKTAWKMFSLKVQVFLATIVALLAVPAFTILARVKESASAAEITAINAIRKANKLKLSENLEGTDPKKEYGQQK
ncbi:hypothetical protein [Sicyoidochytrium minutum DNA virus]|nr:hypothetical protein [Sicyoidochytrium minutum DNA virus]